METVCIYCKIDFINESWAAYKKPKIYCLNCKRYNENIKLEEENPIKVIWEMDPNLIKK